MAYSNILRLQAKCSEVSIRHGAYHVVVRGGGSEFFNQNVREGQHFLLEKIPQLEILGFGGRTARDFFQKRNGPR